MIIWRGWGALAVAYSLLGAALLGGLLGASALGSDAAAGPLAGLGVMIGGVLGAIHGRYLNIVAPKKRAEAWEATERPRLEAAADQGTLVVGNVAPRSPEEAADMIESVIAQGRGVIGKHGPHSVFWIPMEIVGILLFCLGLAIAGATLAATLMG